MIQFPKRVGIALVLAFASVICITAQATAVDADRTRVYRGDIEGDPISKVRLVVRAKEREGPDRNIRVELGADFTETCSDDVSRKNGDVDSTRFSDNSRFGDSTTSESSSGDDAAFAYKGRLLKSGKARGWLTHTHDPFLDSEPNCATTGRLHWKATIDKQRR